MCSSCLGRLGACAFYLFLLSRYRLTHTHTHYKITRILGIYFHQFCSFAAAFRVTSDVYNKTNCNTATPKRKHVSVHERFTSAQTSLGVLFLQSEGDFHKKFALLRLLSKLIHTEIFNLFSIERKKKKKNLETSRLFYWL